MLKGRKLAPANAVWETDHGATAELPATPAKSGKAREAKSGLR
jgi:hypothetical protein